MLLTADTLQRAVGCTSSLARTWLPYLTAATSTFEITTRPRMAHFLAQIGHESDGLSRTVENLNYSAEGLLRTWPSRFTAETAQQYARKPQAIASHVYANRMGNGDEASGDGWKYRGRGLLQNTGKANYEGVRDLLRQHGLQAPDFVEEPDALAEPRWAAMAAGGFWCDHDLNALADLGEFRRITTRVNGGQNGIEDRLARFGRAMKVLA